MTIRTKPATKAYLSGWDSVFGSAAACRELTREAEARGEYGSESGVCYCDECLGQGSYALAPSGCEDCYCDCGYCSAVRDAFPAKEQPDAED